MLTNSSVTLYHYDGSAWTRRYYDKANVYLEDTGTGEKGTVSAKNTVIRIPTDDNIGIKPRDRVVIGECMAESPPKGNDTLSVSIAVDNRRGSRNMHHWKLVCE